MLRSRQLGFAMPQQSLGNRFEYRLRRHPIDSTVWIPTDIAANSRPDAAAVTTSCNELQIVVAEFATLKEQTKEVRVLWKTVKQFEQNQTAKILKQLGVGA